MRYSWSSLNNLERWFDNFSDDSESLPNGFSTMILVQPLETEKSEKDGQEKEWTLSSESIKID
jgi:hypothetical protein